MLNRAPTLHRLGIQAFQPKLIEGKAIQLHPLVCSAFNADFDGDQMAVHVPLSNAAVLEAQTLMLSSHNILNPQNGAPMALPSQDMVLGLYYITKGRKSEKGHPMKGENKAFYSADEVVIAFDHKQVDLHSWIKVKYNNVQADGTRKDEMIETTVGRVLFNQFVPEQVPYINKILTKKSLRSVVTEIITLTDIPTAVAFLDNIKGLGFRQAFEGGLSFNLGDLTIPAEKETLIEEADVKVEEVWMNYNMGLITNNERYNQIIDIWTRCNSELSSTLLDRLATDNQGFNSVFMMLDSGARGSKEQIRQLAGMRGLMAKPKKSGSDAAAIIENPILSNFVEGLSVLEYFISTHGARKGLADTALKTADAGYLTRRLVDVAHDVVITEEDCGTLRGLEMTALKDNEDIVVSLEDRIVGRTALHDVVNPLDGSIIAAAGQQINEHIAKSIEVSPIETVEIRSVLTCESRRGTCVKCYGKNLATGRTAQIGDAVGILAAQSIGEPGTQLTLRTFHVGGTASASASESTLVAKFDGKLEFDEIRTVSSVNEDGDKVEVVLSRAGEVKVNDPKTGKQISTNNIPYGAMLTVKDGAKIKKGALVCSWDPYNAVIVAEVDGKSGFENVIEGTTFREEIDEQTGHREKVIVESRDKTKNPLLQLLDKKGEIVKSYNLPVGAHISIEDNEKVKAGQVVAKIPRGAGKLKDITGGLPRVTELFEARNPSNPAVIAEVDGVVSFGSIKRGNREVFVEPKDGEKKKYMVPLSRYTLVQENDFIRAGLPLCEGAITPNDILSVEGPHALQEYLVNEVQEVYRLQGVPINDKHIETIVRQMMRKVKIEDAGDTRFLEGEAVDKFEFIHENDEIYDKKVVTEAGESENLKVGQIVTLRQLREENSFLKRNDLKLVEHREAIASTSSPLLQGITKASLGTKSFISAASFQETTRVLSEASVAAKEDFLLGLKENVIVGHLIPAGTGLRDFQNSVVGSMEEMERFEVTKKEVSDIL
jgi:DNA-directed RNA polymerase subunit beta'